MNLLAHSSHWLIQLAYLLPVVAFVAWLCLSTWRARRSASRPASASQDREQLPDSSD